MKKQLILLGALLAGPVMAVNANWTVANALNDPSDLDKVEIFTVFTQEQGSPGTLTLVQDPTGTLQNPDGSPATVVRAQGSSTDGGRFVQSYNFPEPAPTNSVYTVYFRWMYPEGGVVSWQEVAPYAGRDEITDSMTRGNGIWFHNWRDLAFAYNGGGTWVVGSDLGLFETGTWYEYWLVVDPANVSFDWYIRGGEWSEIVPVFLDGLFVDIDLELPLKALQQIHVSGEAGLFGPQYYDALHVDYSGENLSVPAGLGSIFGGPGGGETWAGYPVGPTGDVDTGEEWLRVLNVTFAPWIWSWRLGRWIYIEEHFVSDSGSWAYILK